MRTMPSIACAAALAAALSVQAVPYYVSPAGSDTHNDGKSLAAPFKTIQKAAEVAVGGDSVYIRAGIYRETVKPANSGTAGSPIVFINYGSERAVVSGADTVGGWSLDAGSVYKAALPTVFASAMNQAAQVFVDGRMVNLARWPNTTLDISRPVKSTITTFTSKTRSGNVTTAVFEDDRLSPQTDGYYVGAEIYIQPNKEAWSWTLSGRVTAQTGKQLTIQSFNDCGIDGGAGYAVGSRYFLYNMKKLLDTAGEWWLDSVGKVLYLRTPASDNPSTHTVEIKVRDYAFNLDGRSYVTIKGLGIFGANITTDAASGGDCRGYNADGSPRYPWRGAGSVAASSHVILDSLLASYVSHFTDVSGHFFLQWGQSTGMVLSGSDHTIRNCVIRGSAGNGITLLGYRHKALNNYISDVNYYSVDCSAVNTGGATETYDHEIGHNTITRCGRSGITPRRLRNSDRENKVTRIHHNDISYCMLQDWDGGGLYSFGGTGEWTRIDHNYVHDISGFNCSGLYLDFARDYIMDHNLIWNTDWGIQLQGNDGGNNNTLVYNNTIALRNTTMAPYGPFAFAGGSTGNIGSVIRNNISYCINKAQSGYYNTYSGGYAGARKDNNLEWDAVTGSATDPKFVNAGAGNFSIQSTSAAQDKGMSFDTINVWGYIVQTPKDPVTGTAPDIGAFEMGAEKWVAGCRLPLDSVTTNMPPMVDAGGNRVIMLKDTVRLAGTATDDGKPVGSHLAYAWTSVSGPATPTITNGASLTPSVRFTAYGLYVLRLTVSDGDLSASDTVRIDYRQVNLQDLAVIARTPKAPTVDGQAGTEWAGTAALTMTHVTTGAVTNDADLSGSVAALYDTAALYLLYTIADNVIVTTNANFYENDGVELYLDMGNKKNTTNGADDFQFAFRADGNQVTETKHSATAGVRYAVTRTAAGYTLEAVVPWTALGGRPADSSLVGFEAAIIDADSAGGGQQGKKAWFATTDRSWMDPSTFGTAVLAGAGRTRLIGDGRRASARQTIRVELYDLAGRRLTALEAPDSRSAVNSASRRMPSGCYLARVKRPGAVETRRMPVR